MRFLPFLAALVSIATAAPSGLLGTVLNAPAIISSAFQLLGDADSAASYTYTLHLNSANLDGLAAQMQSNAAAGGGPLSMEQVASYAAPSADNLAAVQNYLKAQNIPDSAISYNVFKDEVTIQSTVGQASQLFGAQFSMYKVNGQNVARTKSYTIPQEISGAVQLVQPFANFLAVQSISPIKKRSIITPEEKREIMAELERRQVPASCNTAKVTPACLRALYGTASYVPAPGSTVDVFIAGFIGQSFSQTDLTNFLKTYRPDAASYQMPVINTAGALNIGLLPGIEAMLDTETVASATYPLKSTFFNYGNQLTQGDIFQLAFSDIINNYAKYGKPGVYTISYGSDESGSTPAQAAAMCNSAMKLSALGTTIVVSSGDNGVGGQDGDTCPPFVPTYPGGCQYITSVGATQNFSPEMPVDTSLAGFYSGAAFSNIFPRPSFQSSAVPQYLAALGSQDAGDYNTTGRGFPDVSAQGSKYVVRSMGVEQIVGGTSASAPTFASVVALLNDARRKAGKGNVGWLNPMLYQNPSALTDLTTGTSNGCANTNLGFPAKSGWDPASGLGTPVFSKLLAAYGLSA